MAAVVAIPEFARPRQGHPRLRKQRSGALPIRFVSSPMLLPACAFALGVAGASLCWWVPAWLLAGVLLLGAAAGFAWTHAPRLLLPALALLFLALGWLAAELQPPIYPQDILVTLASANRPVTYLGTIVRVEPEHSTRYTEFFRHTTRNEVSKRIDLQLRAYTWAGQTPEPLTGGIRLTVFADAGHPLPPLGCGAELAATVTLHNESHYVDPGVWDVSAYLRTQGIGAAGSAPAGDVRVLGQAHAGLACRLHALQTTASSRIMALAALPMENRLPAFLRITETDASMLTAMLTGDRSSLQRTTRAGFEQTGAFHLLVVSGLHLAIFSSVVLWATRRLRLPQPVGTLATIALSFAYALFTGYGEPVQRSFWMVALYLLGRLVYRERHALQALAVAGLALIAMDPRALSGASLQMTLLTVVAVAGFAAPLAERSFGPYLHGMRGFWVVALDPAMPPRVAQLRVTLRMLARHLQPVTGRRVARVWMPRAVRFLLRAVELLDISALVELVMALPMAMYFHRVTVLGLPVNVLILPLLGLLLPAAMVCFVVLLAWPPAAILPATVTAALLHLVSAVVNTFAHLAAGNYRLPAPPADRLALWVLLVAAGVGIVRLRPRWALPAAGALLAAAAGLAVAPQPLRHDPHALEVSAIDVGQGDAILVVTPDGRTMLVDAGGLVGQAPGSNFDIGEEVVSPALWARGIRRLDVVAITHAHMDHIGGMPAVLANFRPKVLLVGNNPLSANYKAVLALAAAEGIPVRQHFAGDQWMLGDATHVTALWPSHSYRPKETPTNDDSLVLLLREGRRSAMLEGDAQAPAERAMLGEGLTHVDLLKVGHHGSQSSTTPAFLAALSPEDGVISCGLRNFYGHPKAATLEKLEAAGVRTYRTDLLGEEDFQLTAGGIQAAPWAATR